MVHLIKSTHKTKYVLYFNLLEELWNFVSLICGLWYASCSYIIAVCNIMLNLTNHISPQRHWEIDKIGLSDSKNKKIWFAMEICYFRRTFTQEYFYIYCQTSNIRCTLLGNKIVDHSDVGGALPVGAAPITSSFSTSTPGINGLGKGNWKTRRETFKCWDLLCLILEIGR